MSILFSVLRHSIIIIIFIIIIILSLLFTHLISTSSSRTDFICFASFVLYVMGPRIRERESRDSGHRPA